MTENDSRAVAGGVTSIDPHNAVFALISEVTRFGRQWYAQCVVPPMTTWVPRAHTVALTDLPNVAKALRNGLVHENIMRDIPVPPLNMLVYLSTTPCVYSSSGGCPVHSMQFEMRDGLELHKGDKSGLCGKRKRTLATIGENFPSPHE